MYREVKDLSVKDTMERYPRITAHIVAESLGYATPSCAARILKDATEGRENYCEWVYSCYTTNPLKAVKDAIRNRHYHTGLMVNYRRALDLVKRSIETGQEPLLGSWF